MEAEHNEPIMRAHDSAGSPAKKASPVRAKKTVSAAVVFGKHKRVNHGISIPRKSKSHSNFTEEDAEAATLLSVKSHSSSRSTEKRISKKRPSDMHPLSVAFKDASTDYRRHLYKTTSLKINKTLGTLLHTLHESTLQIIPSATNQTDSSTSPLRLSAPAKYERLAQQLYQPISQFTLSLRRTTNQGQSVRFDQTLETRMLHYEELIAAQTAKLAKLQREWEAVVGEMWKLGAVCLGEKVMGNLLFTEQQGREGAAGSTLQPSSPFPSRATDAESTLFVPEYDTSPSIRKKRATKKHVSFLGEPASPSAEPQTCSKYGASSISAFPTFLYQASRYSQDDELHVVSEIPEEQVKDLEKQIKELGRKEIDGFRDIERDHHAFWKRKTAQLASALKDD